MKKWWIITIMALTMAIGFNLLADYASSVLAYNPGGYRYDISVGRTGSTPILVGRINAVDEYVVGRGTTIITSNPTNVGVVGGITQATLHGNLSDMGIINSTNVSFQWGYNLAYGQTTFEVEKTSPSVYQVTIVNYDGEQVVHYRTVSKIGSLYVYGNDVAIPLTPVQNATTNFAKPILGMIIALGVGLMIMAATWKDINNLWAMIQEIIIVGLAGTITYFAVMLILNIVMG
ncbi:hypothetical protein M0R04_08195 [Candidatus Dojkabacteria bacterium]|nr:hypothetical protein [Candidatus Dojkabacteria bacterium]